MLQLSDVSDIIVILGCLFYFIIVIKWILAGNGDKIKIIKSNLWMVAIIFDAMIFHIMSLTNVLEYFNNPYLNFNNLSMFIRLQTIVSITGVTIMTIKTWKR